MFKKRRYSPSSIVRSFWYLIASFLFFLLWLGFSHFFHPLGQADRPGLISSAGFSQSQTGSHSQYDDILVERVVDGDTLKLENGERVRLIGIDTPESQKNAKAFRDSQRTGVDIDKIIVMGNKVKRFVKDLVENKRVRLEFDRGPKDKYGRLLAYVYLKNQNEEIFVNATIIKMGYAAPMAIPPNVKFAKMFHDLYLEARGQKRGFWKQEMVAQNIN